MNVRHWVDARFSSRSFASGTPVGFFLLGDAVGVLLCTPFWKIDGAKHSARLLADIWLYSDFSATWLRNSKSISSTSRCSSGNRRMADCKASNLISFGIYWKMETNVSDSLVVSRDSGRSLKYCLTTSATSYACWSSKILMMLSSVWSMAVLSFAMRDLTPDFRNIPVWSNALIFSHVSAAWMPFGNVCPVFCKTIENGTPKTFLSVEREKSKWNRA